MPVIKLTDVNVTFKQKSRDIVAVQNESLEIERGDIYGIVGYSGAGKSTLVRTINLLQKPTAGSVLVDIENNDHPVEMTTLNAAALRDKRKKIGMIFQHFNLMDELTVFGNVAQPLKHSSLSRADKRAKITELLALVGLGDRADNYPSQLSGGQKQRVAIARALANDPEILISDEATSALDPRTTNQILALLKKLNQELGLTIVLITHEMQAVKEIANKVAVMENGHIIERGSLLEIFTNPQAQLTKDFINTATNREEALVKVKELLVLKPLAADEILVQIDYVGEETAQPLLSTIFADFAVTTNILYSNMEILTNTPVGTALAVFKGDAAQLNAVLLAFEDHNVKINQIEIQGGIA
ncbi:methionine ABC transporter ATP-binding protein [Weissella soli]|uniref:D-methionine transport system ATP-binding protein n=2 Tax=Weissella soli TaxID=155866 RepID=A0A288QUK0_9LACO|nr:methionine ABC transporter ATP-binding protein [Weissella soli]AOT55783.1 Macrolide export ATP-binding/permease protein MacB [Weissella soli]MCT8394419.1 methionine ABC transporter ATP-binding protein [Weissella soli]NKY83596.1 methionine ABC transporter ATP-binding protein [Weissella soli]RDL06543.1 D-methionine transport system ATP-binding protein [Weissella soli]GEN93404.1 methionine import ATP-binding protein MetN 1 [Weissella soli]